MRVPAQNLLGKEGDGFKIFMKALSYARPMVGAQALGIAQGAYEEAVKLCKRKKAVRKANCEFSRDSIYVSRHGDAG